MNRAKKVYLFCLFLVLALIATPAYAYTISGSVFNSTEGLGNANVTYSSGSTNTSAGNGSWEITGVLNGTYIFIAGSNSYSNNFTSITVNGSDLTDQNFTLSENIGGWGNVDASVAWGNFILGYIVDKAAVFVITAGEIGTVFVIVFLIGAVLRLGLMIFN